MRESTLRDILVSYERKRDKAESELEYRIKDVYSQIPEIKSIDDEVSKIGLELAKLVLLNPQVKDSIIAQSKDSSAKTNVDLINRAFASCGGEIPFSQLVVIAATPGSLVGRLR